MAGILQIHIYKIAKFSLKVMIIILADYNHGSR